MLGLFTTLSLPTTTPVLQEEEVTQLMQHIHCQWAVGSASMGSPSRPIFLFLGLGVGLDALSAAPLAPGQQ